MGQGIKKIPDKSYFNIDLCAYLCNIDIMLKMWIKAEYVIENEMY